MMAVLLLLLGSGSAETVLAEAGIATTTSDESGEQLSKEERMNKHLDRLETSLVLVTSCQSDENCTVDADLLDNMSTTLSERIATLEEMLLDPDNATRPSHEHRERDDNLTKEERMQAKLDRIAVKIELIESCLANADCEVDEETLNEVLSKLQDKQEKIETCMEGGECEKPGKRGKGKRGGHEGRRGGHRHR